MKRNFTLCVCAHKQIQYSNIKILIFEMWSDVAMLRIKGYEFFFILHDLNIILNTICGSTTICMLLVFFKYALNIFSSGLMINYPEIIYAKNKVIKLPLFRYMSIYYYYYYYYHFCYYAIYIYLFLGSYLFI